MKVGELIEVLQGFDAELRVMLSTWIVDEEGISDFEFPITRETLYQCTGPWDLVRDGKTISGQYIRCEYCGAGKWQDGEEVMRKPVDVVLIDARG